MYLIAAVLLAMTWTTSLPDWLFASVASLFVMHIVMEYPRWQMGMVYIVASTIIYYGPQERGVAARLVSLLVLAVSALLTTFLPVPSLPSPDGVYKVARTCFVIPDNSNQHGFSISVYYPTEKSLVPASYFRNGFSTILELGAYMNLPSFVASHLLLINPPFSSARSPIVPSKKFPVIIFSHSLWSLPDVHSTVIAQIVSHGFIVVAPEHTDGSAIFANAIRHGLEVHIPHAKLTASESQDKSLQVEKRKSQLQHRVKECRRALDYVFDANKGKNEAKNIFSVADCSKIGIAGHSFGASTAIAAAENDPRFQVILASDVWTLPLDADRLFIKQPLMLHLCDKFVLWKENFNATRAIFANSHGDSQMVAVRDTGHHNFTDLPWVAYYVFSRVGTVGKLDPNVALSTHTNQSIAFLQRIFQLPVSTAGIDVDNYTIYTRS